MQIVFIVLSIGMLLYMVGRKIDFFSIATVCTIIYNYYCAMGTVFISSHEKAGAYYYYSDILPQVYFIVIAELLILFAAMVIYDRRKPLEHIQPGYNEDVFSPEQQNKVFVIACIVSNLILLTNVASIGLSNLRADKASVWGQTNTLYITGIWLGMACFAYALNHKKPVLAICALPPVLVHLFIGSRAYFAAIAIVFLVYVGKRMKASFKYNIRIYALGALFLVAIMLYKKIWLDLKAGDMAAIGRTLSDPDTYAWVFRWGEPRIVLANLNYILDKGIRLDLGGFVTRIVSLIPFANDFVTSEYNIHMSTILSEGMKSSYGLASNFWGECWAMGSYPFLFMVFIAWCWMLRIGNEMLYQKSWVSYFMTPLIAYLAFYIHRMDLVKVIGNGKMVVFAMILWFLFAGLLTRRWVFCLPVRRKER